MASAAIAGGKFTSRVAAITIRPGAARVLPAGGEADFLAPLPVAYLPSNDAMRWRLALLGIETMGDVAQMPLGAFQAQFGPDGKRCWELAAPRDAWFAIKAAIVRRPPERPVEELEVELVGLSAESGKQATMFEGKGRLWRQVEEAVRQLASQRERPAVGKVMPVDPASRIPERRAVLLELEPE